MRTRLPPRSTPTVDIGSTSELQRLAGVALGGCFCEHCRAAAVKRGIDWDAMLDRLKWLADGFDGYNHKQAFDLRLLFASSMTATALLTEIPELYAFLQFRTDTITAFFKSIYEAVHDIKPDIDVRLNHFAGHPELMGLDLRSAGKFMDSIRSSDYADKVVIQHVRNSNAPICTAFAAP